MSIIEAPQAPTGVEDRIPLSFNQQFLFAFDKGDGEGPFGPKYNIICGWRLLGAVQVDALRGALDDVVERHETLRTIITRDDEGGYQKICPASSPQFQVKDLTHVAPQDRDVAAEELLSEVESGEYGLAELPLLRAVLGRFGADDAVLVLIAHHTAVDEWSMRLIMRDLAARYAARSGHEAPPLPDVPQYQEYTRWELATSAEDPASEARTFWRESLAGARIYGTPTDHPRSANLPKTTSWHRFWIPAEITFAVQGIARTTRSSPFMVLLAAYCTLLRKRTGTTDIVVPTFTSGRGQARFQDTVGSFFNFVPLRIDLSGCESFREVVERTRATCIDAYAHDIPFANILQEAPELMLPSIEDNLAVCAFQVFRSPLAARQSAGDLEYSEIRRRHLSQAAGGDIPDGAMWHLEIDHSGDIVGMLGFNGNLFEENTIKDMASEFHEVLRSAVTAPYSPLNWS
ncbi:condensation domain-containing protein [Sphaerisporangium sp. TRM90804]|uniref:condensation domain-containing protein n=1 Tax=Sphaerisporangium sp. TRM90804 TaxID=3031113 RepID=UPI002446FE62|nr:condensation domain-containing protein [Sphaerisporangium sp. TRM90804]MDH2424483.1 condensation domain-containing protein [Sphaerisporangium sp. TRM90804]